MADILKFEPRPKKKKVPKKQVAKKVVEKEKKNERQKRHDKAHRYLSYINSLHKHKFSYPTLACRFSKDSHSIDVLYGHCFTSFGKIQENMDRFPGIEFAKKVACERQEEIIDFIDWRLSKYQEAKFYYGSDLVIIDIYTETFRLMCSHFKELFKGVQV
jgi:hypothetical protein